MKPSILMLIGALIISLWFILDEVATEGKEYVTEYEWFKDTNWEVFIPMLILWIIAYNIADSRYIVKKKGGVLR